MSPRISQCAFTWAVALAVLGGATVAADAQTRSASLVRPVPTEAYGTVGFGSTRPVSRTYTTRHPSQLRTRYVQEEIVGDLGMQEGEYEIVDGGVYGDVSQHMGMHIDSCESCGAADCATCGVDVVGPCGAYGPCGQGCLVPCPQLWLRDVEAFLGVQGFKGPPNQGQDGSFGFNEGVNLGVDIPCFTWDLFAAQFGVNGVQSNFSGAGFTDENREQIFVTAGLFRRVDYGLQGGAVVDYRFESWYTKVNVAQIRARLSWVYPTGNEFGFDLASSIQDDTNPALVNGVTVTETWTPTDTYTFFYRHSFDPSRGTTGRIFAGFSGESDTILGMDYWMPLNEFWAVKSGFAYVMPQDNLAPAGAINESWNVGMNLVWYPGGLMRHRGRYQRPMFDVADNGSFFITKQ